MRLLLAYKAFAQLLRVCVRERSLSARTLLEEAVEASPAPSRDAADDDRIIATVRRALALAERVFPVRVTCLERSVALQRLLHARGVITQLRIGVRKDPSELAAHAWLEHRGRALDAAVNERFQSLRPLRSNDE
jgi:Transglutaminase-like superfamily